MRDGKKGQISTEYLIVMGFVTFLVISLLGMAFFYVGQIRDTMKMNQINDFGKKIVNSAETVYFAGPPSRATVLLYMPIGVTDIHSGGPNNEQLIVTISTDTGQNILAFTSNVPLNLPSGAIKFDAGIKRIRLEATSSDVSIKQV